MRINLPYLRKKPLRLVPWLGMAGLGGFSLLIGILLIWMPDVGLQAALRGASVWWDVLFPALFPFFVLSDLLLGLGVVHFAGALLDPLMRPVFKLPGVGGFVVAMGFASGYPVGARLTSRLMEDGQLNREQGERLVTMTTTSDPIFLIGAVCIGFFGTMQPAFALAVAHYGGAMIVGLVSGFSKHTQPKPLDKSTGGRFRAAVVAMHRARLTDGRTFAVILQQAVRSSLMLMVIVGGLVVFFSAMLELLVHSGLLTGFRLALSQLIHLFGAPSTLSTAYVHGTFEVTLGAKAAAEAAGAPLVDRVAAAAFVLSWAGLSVHAQVAGLMTRTSWRYIPFARDRLLHGLIAIPLVYICWPLFASDTATNWLTAVSSEAVAAFGGSGDGSISAGFTLPTAITMAMWPLLLAATCLVALVLFSAIVRSVQRLFGHRG